MSDLWTLGLGKADLTPDVRGVAMLGWGIPTNTVEGVADRIHARALLVEERGGAAVALVCLEICYITALLRQAVLARLAEAHPHIPLSPAQVVLTTTHTHSAPGGYSAHRFDNASIPGFQPAVLEAYVAGAVAAVAQAWARRAPGRLRVVQGEIPPDLPVAFNRSLRALHRNPDVPRHYHPYERHLAVDRTMAVLRVEDQHGAVRGLVSWFGVHCTSVHSDNTLITGDNKGWAARFSEQALRDGGCAEPVCLFLQGATGDVTPNHRRWPGKRLPGGSAPDDHDSARDNGRIQAEHALGLVATARDAPALAGPLRVALEYADMGDIPVDADLAGGRSDARTAPGVIGARMLEGTWEGPGAPRPVGRALALLARGWQAWARATPPLRTAAQRAWLARQGPKAPLMSVGDGTVFSLGATVLFIPPGVEPIVDHLAQQQRALGTEPWLPQVVPLHLVTLGPLGIVGVPAELTTQAARRLRAEACRVLGVSEALYTGYCGDYSGYVTTPEEYEVQGYEGAFTQFGPLTLPGWLTRLRRLADRMTTPVVSIGEAPLLLEGLEARRHRARGWIADGAPQHTWDPDAARAAPR